MFEVISTHEHHVTGKTIGGQRQQYFRSRKFKDKAKMSEYLQVLENSSTYVSHEINQGLTNLIRFPPELKASDHSKDAFRYLS